MPEVIIVDHTIVQELKIMQEEQQKALNLILQKLSLDKYSEEDLTTKEAAYAAKVDIQTINRWRIRGYIKRYGNAGSYRYKRTEIEAHRNKKNEH